MTVAVGRNPKIQLTGANKWPYIHIYNFCMTYPTEEDAYNLYIIVVTGSVTAGLTSVELCGVEVLTFQHVCLCSALLSCQSRPLGSQSGLSGVWARFKRQGSCTRDVTVGLIARRRRLISGELQLTSSITAATVRVAWPQVGRGCHAPSAWVLCLYLTWFLCRRHRKRFSRGCYLLVITTTNLWIWCVALF